MSRPNEPVVFEHNRFGRLELDPGELIQFGGLPGFPTADRFVMLRHDRDSAFLWLVCLDEPDLAFVVADPGQFFPDYGVSLTPSLRRSLDAKDDEPLEIYAIATVREGAVSFNLAAPLVINAARGRGVQTILEAGRYSTREPLPAAPAPEPVARAPRGAQIESKPQR